MVGEHRSEGLGTTAQGISSKGASLGNDSIVIPFLIPPGRLKVIPLEAKLFFVALSLAGLAALGLGVRLARKLRQSP